jgi:hypothetical protein
MPTSSPHLSNSSHASRGNREIVLLLVGIRAGRSVNLFVAKPVGRSALIGVVRNRLLQFEEVGAGSGIDVGGVALAVDVALTLYVVLILEAAGALELRVGCCEVDFEAVVAASGAAEDEIVDKERAVRLGDSALAAAVAVFAAGCGGGSSGGEAGGTEGDDSRDTHFCEGLLLLLLLFWFYVVLKRLRFESRSVRLVIKVLSVEYCVVM